MDQALEVLPSDYWRWWLLSNIPENSDSDFTWENMQLRTNKDLADTLGNFVSRVSKFCSAKFGDQIPMGAYGASEQMVMDELATRIAAYADYWEKIEIRKAASELRAIWVVGNQYWQSAKPWVQWTNNKQQAQTSILFAFNLVRLYAILSRPFIPDASDMILKNLGIEEQALDWPGDIATAMQALSAGHHFTITENLFAKITDATCEEMTIRFAGK